jgi:hypothetical protein
MKLTNSISIKKPPDKIILRSDMIRVKKNTNCNTNIYLRVNKRVPDVNKEKKLSVSNKAIKSSVNVDNDDNSDSLISDDSKKNINIPDWYDLDISSKFNIPLIISNKHNYSCVPNNNIGFGNNEYNNKHVRLYNFNHKSKQQFVNTKFIDDDENLQILKDKALKTKNTALSNVLTKLLKIGVKLKLLILNTIILFIN